MFEWMKAHKTALIAATCMFAVMAMMMGEAFFGGSESFLSELTSGDNDLALWIWRAGGAVTWPVFMFLLLRPHLGRVANGNGVLAAVCAAAAVYGGFGLWLLSTILSALAAIPQEGTYSMLYPLLGVVSILLPYLYVWGFVALYGWGRMRLLGTNDSGWVKPSAVGAVVGVYGIGVLIYLALALVFVPISMVFVLSTVNHVFAEHLFVDLCAVAISTGNFVSQWWGFSRVDEYFERKLAANNPQAAAYVGAPAAPGVYVQAGAPGAPVGGVPGYVPAASQAPAAPQTQQPMAQLPRLVCTCGQELTVDRSCLPRLVARERFCPNCGARIAH